MRTLPPVKGALVAAACALALLPAGAAQAGSGPAPAPGSDRAQTSMSEAPEDSPFKDAARQARVCTDAYQIGSTGYVKRKGETIASVKQFYSPRCNRNYGYLYVWESFRKKHPHWSTNIAVYDFRTKKLVGLRTWDRTSQESFWSHPADTVRHCTAARGVVRAPGDTAQHFAYSSKRC